jgi:hypothetical protein
MGIGFKVSPSEIISPIIDIKSGVKADKAARDFTPSIASVYRLSTSTVTSYTFGHKQLTS